MTIPFLNFLRKAVPQKTPPHATPVRSTTVERPSAERLSKTVMPNSTRTFAPQDEFEDTPPGPVAPRVYSLGSKKNADLPPAVALALEPNVERVISLDLRDVAQQMPGGWIRPLSDSEASRRVLLKAAELEKGMSSGRPCVCLTSIYHQVPEIFLRPVPDSDQAQVPLPYNKVLEQFSNVQTRNDQRRDQTVPQLETPFLRVTLEDNTRFGTTMAPVQISDQPLAKMELATAETIAASQPEMFAKPQPPPPAQAVPSVAQLPISRAKDGSRPVIKLHVEDLPSASPMSEPERETPAATAPAPTRIPFKISPIGTGAPASERVPASSGPSVPTSVPAPTRIAFKMPNKPVAVSAPPVSSPNECKSEGGITLTLPLKPILMSLPPFQLTGDIKDIPDSASLEVPFSLVAPQLASGRVSIKVEDFAKILPNEYRKFFSASDIHTPIILPLQDVLKNLPAASLSMRDDQEEQERGADFKTPFSAKAAEDAKRFNPTEPKPLKGLPQHRPPPAAPEIPKTEPPAAKIPHEKKRTALQTALDTDDELDAKAVVTHVGKMVGVEACAIMFGDGLSLAGTLPGKCQADGLCAMAPSFLQRLDDHLTATKLGALRSMTVSCAKDAVTFFMHDNLCLAALHAQEELAADVRQRLECAVRELSKKYSQPA